MHKLTIKIPVYACQCHVIIDDDIVTTINKYVKKLKWDKTTALSDAESVHGYAVSPFSLENYYIFYDTQSLTLNYISHEISHLVDFILEERGIELIGETRAYTTGYLTEKILNFIVKKNLLLNEWITPKDIEVKKSTKSKKLTQENQSPLQTNNDSLEILT